MPIVSTKEYELSLLDMNQNVFHVYINSFMDSGGGRRIVTLRQHERGLPLTLKNNYTDSGGLTSDTEARDVLRIENEFQRINKILGEGWIVCLPIYPLTEELMLLEKQSPKVGGYLKKRLEVVQSRFQKAVTNV
tara:strand:+ start:695 stop:1096 length:402 start_codon:yes stop_codon:yes gene_type:complete